MADTRRLEADWDWESFFRPEDLETGKQFYKEDKIREYEESKDLGDWVTGKVGTYHPQIWDLPHDYNSVAYDNDREDLPGTYSRARDRWGRTWYDYDFDDTQHGCSGWGCTCSRGSHNCTCSHMAAIMYAFAAHHPDFFHVEETDEERDERIKEEEEREAEKKREAEIRKESQKHVDVLPLLPKAPAGKATPYFNLRPFFQDAYTSEYDLKKARKIDEDKITPDVKVEVKGDAQILSARAEVDGVGVTIKARPDGLTELDSLCGCESRMLTASQYADRRELRTRCLCVHKLLAVKKLIQYVDEKDPGDATDETGFAFFKSVAAMQDAAPDTAEKAVRPNVVGITPLLYISYSSTLYIWLAIKAAPPSGRALQVRNLSDFLDAYRKHGRYELSRAQTIDFAADDVTAQSQPLLSLLLSCDEDLAMYSDMMRRSLSEDAEPALGSGVKLAGRMMDRFYDMYEGKTVSARFYDAKTEFPLTLASVPCRAKMKVTEKKGKDGSSLGIDVTGEVPVFLSTDTAAYFYDGTHLARVTEADRKRLQPFTDISKQDRSFSFSVGTKNLAEFYYRVLPELADQNSAVVEDQAGSRVTSELPVEPSFTFTATLEDDLIRLAAVAAYGEETHPLVPDASGASPAGRDIRQEERVLSCLGDVTDEFDPDRQCFLIHASDNDRLYAFLTDGIEKLSRFGIVRGNEAFDKLKVRPLPTLRFEESVRFETGIMDLSIKTRGMTTWELLAVLDSYHKKQRYHRLKSGDFISLDHTESLDEAEDVLKRLGIPFEDILQKAQTLPLYRALYVDSLLGEREDLVTRRDASMKSLLRSFKTLQEADYEVPETLADTLRPYQAYGFRWLSVLAHTGLGGILADEMGLGKTLQYLTLVYSLKLEREAKGEGTAPSLVICPASLVYNWKEEAGRFTPELAVETLSGTVAARRAQFARMKEKPADLYITSYDLVRRDVASYYGVEFLTVALDEAQYIKNAGTAASKAVKTLSSKVRFALTGTPIENRLSELWSIFDFLMPGFLYSSKVFSAVYEVPIMKEQDAAAQDRLRKMVSPFILRRLKTDVLRDLPPKMEEIRYAEMGEEQRRLYDAQVAHMRSEIEDSDSFSRQKIQIFAELTRLRQICCDPSLIYDDYKGGSAKREAVMELIRSAMDGGHRMLVFSQFVSMLELLEKDLKKEGISCFKLTGSTSKEDRMSLVHDFNEGDVPVFLISLKAGGTGLNLTGADIVIHYDPWWNLAVQNQATDRAHRIGQTHQVTVYRLIARDTIEEKIVDLQNMKQDLADALISGEGESLLSLTKEEFLELLS